MRRVKGRARLPRIGIASPANWRTTGITSSVMVTKRSSSALGSATRRAALAAPIASAERAKSTFTTWRAPPASAATPMPQV